MLEASETGHRGAIVHREQGWVSPAGAVRSGAAAVLLRLRTYGAPSRRRPPLSRRRPPPLCHTAGQGRQRPVPAPRCLLLTASRVRKRHRRHQHPARVTRSVCHSALARQPVSPLGTGVAVLWSTHQPRGKDGQQRGTATLSCPLWRKNTPCDSERGRRHGGGGWRRRWWCVWGVGGPRTRGTRGGLSGGREHSLLRTGLVRGWGRGGALLNNHCTQAL